MWRRLVFVLIAGFWLAMMALLWRSEFTKGRPMASSVPVTMVLDHILTAPDASTLDIRYGSNHVGYCRWMAEIGQEFATGARVADSPDEFEGMVEDLKYYRLDVDGSIALPDLPHRVRFDFMLRLDTNRVWQEFTLTINLRPDLYRITATATSQTVRVFADSGDKFDRTFTFAELQNPQKLLTQLGGPALPLMLGIVGAQPARGTNFMESLGMRWQARNDVLYFGKNKVRAYRLHGTLLDRFHATFFVSPVGEILRVELPNNILLMNEAVAALKPSP